MPEEKNADRQMLEEAIQKTGDFLQEMYPAPLSEKLQASLWQLRDAIDKDNDPAMLGLGLYVSPGHSTYFSFPFPVQGKISISDTFEMRELLLLQHYATDYLLLEINGKKVSLYKGCLNKLEEIRDDHFPKHFHETYEYAKPARGLSFTGDAVVQSFEKDKSIIMAERLKHFYREADEALNAYLKKVPLVVAGPKKDIAWLEEVSRHNKNVIATINGNYTHTTLPQLAEKAWPYVSKWIDREEHNSILEVIQQTGHHLVEEGIIIDIIDDIMKKVIEKKGEVKFVKDGALQEQQHIALITRY